MKTCNRTILIIQLCCFVGLLSAQTNLGLNLDNHLSTLTRTKAEKTEAKISKFIQRLDNDEQLENPIILQHEAKEKYFYMERSEAIQVPGTEVFVSESFVETDDKVIIVRLDETEYMVRYIDQEFEYDYYGSHKEGFQFRKLKIEPEEDFVCGHDHGDVEVENQIKKKLTQRRPTCGTNEYILELGVALDFEYIDNIHGGNTAAAVTRVVTDFFGVRAKYGECTMRIFVQLIDMVIEPCDNCLFIAPWCGNNNSDAYLYNQLFNSSPFKPAGDVISLVTGRNLRGVACVNDIGGMSYGFGGVCNDNWTSQRSNIYEGRTFSRVGLWVHEIGHTLGYGSLFDQHPEVGPGFFYDNNNVNNPWHPETIEEIQEKLEDTDGCVEEVDYCCIDMDDVYICGESFSIPLDNPGCNGRITLTGSSEIWSTINGNTVVGNMNGNSQVPVTFNQATDNLNCNFNTHSSFTVFNCEAMTNNTGVPPAALREICIGSTYYECFDFPCVEKWDNLNVNSNLFVLTNGGEVCISSNFGSQPGIYTIRLRPHFMCGTIGDQVTWTIRTVECEEGGDHDGDGRPDPIPVTDNGESSSRSSDNSFMDLNIYPNPFTQNVKIENSRAMQKVEIFDLQGKVVQSIDFDIDTFEYILDSSHLQSSMYIFRVYAEDGSVETKRLLKI